MDEKSRLVLDELLKGNNRFQSGNIIQRVYNRNYFAQLAKSQSPIAAVITCADSRVAPEIVFDQELGKLLVCRVPGNVVSESAKWVVDLAVGEYHVPLVVVMGHTHCLAVETVVKNVMTSSGGELRLKILSSLYKAQRKQHDDLTFATIKENINQTVSELSQCSLALREAISNNQTSCVGMIFDIACGKARLIEN